MILKGRERVDELCRGREVDIWIVEDSLKRVGILLLRGLFGDGGAILAYCWAEAEIVGMGLLFSPLLALGYISSLLVEEVVGESDNRRPPTRKLIHAKD